ncbi:sulfate transporter 1.3 [Tanacetum coccineum]
MFFSDDPLRPFKDQPKSRKLMLGLEAIFPILEWGRSYNRKKFRGDLIAGLTIASLCIPQDIGKLMLGLEAIFPILEWGRSYNRKKFRGDLIAGLTIASLCIPQIQQGYHMILSRVGLDNCLVASGFCKTK